MAKKSLAYELRHGIRPEAKRPLKARVDKPRARRVTPPTHEQYLQWLIHCSMRITPTNRTFFGVAPSLYARNMAKAVKE